MTPFSDLPAGLRTALEEQWACVASRGLPCGSAVVDGAGSVVARGRNRAYDEPTRTDPLERTPLAHAELNALARLDTAADLGALTLWSTQRPCAMCSAALDFTGLGQVRFLGEDPSDAAQSDAERQQHDDVGWQHATTVLFLYTGAVLRGERDGNLAGQPEPLRSVVLDLARDDLLGDAARAGTPLADALVPHLT